MKILMTVDPGISVPPNIYGGVERIAYGLLVEYTKMGHEVLLLANPDSTAPEAKKIFGWNDVAGNSFLGIARNAMQLTFIYLKYKPDVIHSFSRLLFLYPLLIFIRKVKVLVSYGRFISKTSTSIASKIGREKLYFTSAAEHMLTHLNDTSKWRAIFNFTDTDYFVPTVNPSLDYLAFLGRIEPIKGPIDAIKAAINTNNKLIIAGNIPDEHRNYFNTVIKPYLSHPLISYIGPVNDEKKRYFLQNAKALLFPINLKVEAFGIVMVESFACGTPVIGYDIAAVPEVIIDEVNGYRAKDFEDMTKLIAKIDCINRDNVRKDAEERFSQRVSANNYIEYLNSILN